MSETPVQDNVIKTILARIPKLWVAGILATGLGLGVFGIWYGISHWENAIEDKTVLVCNTTQLEESVKAADRRAADASKRVAELEKLLSVKEVQIEERIVFRDRVVTKIEIIEAELEGEELIVEKLSPTSQALMEEIIGDPQ